MFTLPSVSCILPTGYGHELVKLAIASFVNQVYFGELELVIVDNNDTPILENEEVANMPDGFTYLRTHRMGVGALRNLGTKYASGEVCINWDEDDWSHPGRVMAQVERLIDSGKAVTGYHNLLYYDMKTGGTFKYLYSPSGVKHPPYTIGTSQAYLRSWWETHPFVESGIEDQPFGDAALHAGQLDSVDGEQWLVARVHDRNVCAKLTSRQQFPEVERSTFPQEFFTAIGGTKEEPR